MPGSKAPSIPKSGEKWCNDCQTFKVLDDFYNSRSKYDGKSSYCKSCMKERDNGRERYHIRRAKKLEELGGVCVDCGEGDERVLRVVGGELLCANCWARRS